MSFHPLRRELQVFSSIHFIQIDIGYEFPSIEKRITCFFPPSTSSKIDIGYKFLSIEKRVTCFLHFIQIYMGYEFSSIEKKVTCFLHFIQIYMGYEFSSIEKKVTCFLHFIQIYTGYEISSIEKKVICFFLHSLHPNRHRLWVFWSIEKRGLHLFSSIHKTDYETFHPWTRTVMTSLLNLLTMVGTQ